MLRRRGRAPIERHRTKWRRGCLPILRDEVWALGECCFLYGFGCLWFYGLAFYRLPVGGSRNAAPSYEGVASGSVCCGRAGYGAGHFRLPLLGRGASHSRVVVCLKRWADSRQSLVYYVKCLYDITNVAFYCSCTLHIFGLHLAVVGCLCVGYAGLCGSCWITLDYAGLCG